MSVNTHECQPHILHFTFTFSTPTFTSTFSLLSLTKKAEFTRGTHLAKTNKKKKLPILLLSREIPKKLISSVCHLIVDNWGQPLIVHFFSNLNQHPNVLEPFLHQSFMPRIHTVYIAQCQLVAALSIHISHLCPGGDWRFLWAFFLISWFAFNNSLENSTHCHFCLSGWCCILSTSIIWGLLYLISTKEIMV